MVRRRAGNREGNPPDPRAAGMIAIGAAAAMSFAALGVVGGKSRSLRRALAFGLLLFVALHDPKAFLDGTLHIGAAKRRRVASIADIRAVHAADKYSEVELVTGERVLDERPLSHWSAALPAAFIRAHRCGGHVKRGNPSPTAVAPTGPGS
jgi:hypothetical protein